MKNNIFNPSRFLLLMKKDIIEQKKNYLLNTLSSSCTLLTLYIYYSYRLTQNIDNQITDHMWFNYQHNMVALTLSIFIISACVHAFYTIHSPISSMKKRIAHLTNPASALEKYLVQWLQIIPGYLLLFSLAVTVANLLRVAVCAVFFPQIGALAMDDIVPLDKYDNIQTVILVIALGFLLHSLFMVGAAIWKKNVIAKSILSIAVLIAFSVWLIQTLGFRMNDSNTTFMYALTALLISFTLINWIFVYFRLKETDIVTH